ncbi:hypothetical protein [Nostoc sp. C117]|uniref:hypothetical protein n=1 Tax=Nostoc sp. C117 TaxID=3349875 RepID=UPI00370D06D9
MNRIRIVLVNGIRYLENKTYRSGFQIILRIQKAIAIKNKAKSDRYPQKNLTLTLEVLTI